LSDTDADWYTSFWSMAVFRQYHVFLSPTGLSGRKKKDGKPILKATRASSARKAPLESAA